jgi:hypothetical protein
MSWRANVVVVVHDRCAGFDPGESAESLIARARAAAQ